MVWIPPGSFMMGTPQEEIDRLNSRYSRLAATFSAEEPHHRVTITRGFWLGKYELTQEQWECVMRERPWLMKDHVVDSSDNPAVYISWHDVLTFIGHLNREERHSIYRLPTEAEWEHACRAGTTTPWSFGDNQHSSRHYAWYRFNTRKSVDQYAHARGTKRPNAWGLHDMHGNVSEWVQDRYDPDYYDLAPDDDPPGSLYGTARVIRGGNFTSLPWALRSAHRGKAPPEQRRQSVGARIVRQEP